MEVESTHGGVSRWRKLVVEEREERRRKLEIVGGGGRWRRCVNEVAKV